MINTKISVVYLKQKNQNFTSGVRPEASNQGPNFKIFFHKVQILPLVIMFFTGDLQKEKNNKENIWQGEREVSPLNELNATIYLQLTVFQYYR